MLEYEISNADQHPILLFQIQDGIQGIELCVQMLHPSEFDDTFAPQDHRPYNDWLELWEEEQPFLSIPHLQNHNKPVPEEERLCFFLQTDGAAAKHYRHLLNMLAAGDAQGHILKITGTAQDTTLGMPGVNPSQYSLGYDDLTQTYNRRLFWEMLQKSSAISNMDLCLILFDINGLKLVNNVFGQQKGDYVLTEVAHAIKIAFTENRHIARIDGDEFAVITYNILPEEIEKNCEAVAEFCRQTDKQLLPLSISWGTACQLEAKDHEDLFHIAESRLFDHKIIQRSSAYSQAVYSLKEALRARNAETADHLVRMEKMVDILGKRLFLSSNDLARLKLLASMHDVGKLGIPDHILSKPGPLSPEEWRVMQSHCDIGCNIMRASSKMSGIALEVLSHHERWDGTGYPTGKKGDEIPLLAQIISVVDSYDAMTHRRIYKEAISHSEALSELRRCRGSQFSPEATDLFLEAFSAMTQEEMERLMEEPI